MTRLLASMALRSWHFVLEKWENAGILASPVSSSEILKSLIIPVLWSLSVHMISAISSRQQLSEPTGGRSYSCYLPGTRPVLEQRLVAIPPFGIPLTLSSTFPVAAAAAAGPLSKIDIMLRLLTQAAGVSNKAAHRPTCNNINAVEAILEDYRLAKCSLHKTAVHMPLFMIWRKLTGVWNLKRQQLLNFLKS